MRSPCLSCGVLVVGTRCPDCEARFKAIQAPATPGRIQRRRGYDGQWKRLSARARQLQPFCSDCGATEELQADHSPVAWARREAGLPIRLQDIDVKCPRCNVAAGAARGANVRPLTANERRELQALKSARARQLKGGGEPRPGRRSSPMANRRADYTFLPGETG